MIKTIPSTRAFYCRSLIVGLASALAIAATTGATGVAAQTPQRQSSRIIEPLVPGDEPVVVIEHRIQTADGPLDYEARTGRMPIRDQQTGEVRGHIFFVAYVVKTNGAPRPLTFAWNGGPTVPSSIVHLHGLGPRRAKGDTVVDNPDTLLRTSDLVFMDAMETGFSRPETPKDADEFFNMKGDIAATVEFIRAYRDRFHANDQPLFVCGESYGVFRAAGVVDAFAQRHVKVAGTILVSGDIPNIPQPVAFYDAMHIPARTATALYYKRLAPDLMKDPEETMRAAYDWAVNAYEPALKQLDTLTDAEKDKIVDQLARYTGMRPDQVDRKTLVIHVTHFLNNFFDGDGTKVLSGEDTREFASDDDSAIFGSSKLIDNYLRGELGYTTDLTYTQIDKGYSRTPGRPTQSSGAQFYYNIDDLTPEDNALSDKYGEVTWYARSMPKWIPDALQREKNLKVFVSTSRYDPLNMCEGDVRVTAQLPADQRSRVSNHCYQSGHVVYLDDKARPIFLNDVAGFIRQTVASLHADDDKKGDDKAQS